MADLAACVRRKLLYIIIYNTHRYTRVYNYIYKMAGDSSCEREVPEIAV